MQGRWYEPVNATHDRRCTYTGCNAAAIAVLCDADTYDDETGLHAVAACRRHLSAGTSIHGNGTSSAFRPGGNVIRIEFTRRVIQEVAA